LLRLSASDKIVKSPHRFFIFSNVGTLQTDHPQQRNARRVQESLTIRASAVVIMSKDFTAYDEARIEYVG
jgi:hypothetical protein